MAKAVFTTRVEPDYDDRPEAQYHFPSRYLRSVKETLNDWILYYEPRRKTSSPSSAGGRQAYFATARVAEIRKDPLRSDHYYAMVENYLEFSSAVPFVYNDRYLEHRLLKPDGSTNKGLFGWAVRSITLDEYNLIVSIGCAQAIAETSAPDQQARPIVESIVRRPFRDSAFTSAVRTAYRNTCAMTGLQMINGGGRPEVQAAHIIPVKDNGPDAIRNGLALSGTIHWMFDRGLVSVQDDYTILVADRLVPAAASQLLRSDRRLCLPNDDSMKPHPKYMRYHRESIYKG